MDDKQQWKFTSYFNKNFEMRGNRKLNNSRKRASRQGVSLVKVAVLPMTINYAFTASGSHDIHPETASSSDVVFRSASIDVFVAVAAPQSLQISLYNNGNLVLATETIVVGTNSKRIRLRSPKNLDYGPADGSYWRIILTGAGRIGGSATFTCKETLTSAL